MGARIAAATQLGTSRRTLSRILRENERAAVAWEFGRSELLDELLDKLITKARRGDTVSVLFALKSIFGFRDHGPAEGEERAPSVVINLPGAVSREEWQNAITFNGVEDDGDIA